MLIRHQLDSYHLIMKNKARDITDGTSQAEIFNIIGQLRV